jgi:lipopolysaccharide export system permease protein
VAEYYLVKAPDFLWIVMPVALLLALLYCLTQLARHHELTAMRAAGVGMWRLVFPYLGVGVTLSLVLLAVNEGVAPRASVRAAEILHGPTSRVQKNLNFQNAADRRIWRIGEYDPQRAVMSRVRVDWDLPDGSSRKLVAESARYENRAWVFRQVTDFRQASAESLMVTTVTNELAVPEFGETPAQIATEIKMAGLRSFRASSRVPLSFVEIRDYLRWHPGIRREERAFLETLMHARLAMPWTCLVVVLIAVPFGVPSGRRNVVVGVASSLLICFVYYALRELAVILGSGGVLPAPVAAWLPNLVFGGVGMVLTARAR